MSSSTTSISCKGDRTYAKAVKAIAFDMGIEQGDLVRQALDKYCGAELRARYERIAARNVSENYHSEANNDNDDTSDSVEKTKGNNE